MVSRAELEQKPAMAGLTEVRLGSDGSILLEFDLTQARLELAAEMQPKENESAPKALVALCGSASLALPTSPHAR